jgi:hypothetical protein
MIKKLVVAAAATLALSGTAYAWEGQVVQCYDTVLVPAQFETHQTLVRAARTEWEHRNGQAVQVYYPPVYVETRTQTRPERYVNRPAPCND